MTSHWRGPSGRYTISQLAREFGVTPRAIRHYECEGLLAPAREGIARVFTPQDRARLRLIVEARRMTLPMSDIRRILALRDQGDSAAAGAGTARIYARRLQELTAQKRHLEAALAALTRALETLDPAAAAQASDDEVPGASGPSLRSRVLRSGATRGMG